MVSICLCFFHFWFYYLIWCFNWMSTLFCEWDSVHLTVFMYVYVQKQSWIKIWMTKLLQYIFIIFLMVLVMNCICFFIYLCFISFYIAIVYWLYLLYVNIPHKYIIVFVWSMICISIYSFDLWYLCKNIICYHWPILGFDLSNTKKRNICGWRKKKRRNLVHVFRKSW